MRSLALNTIIIIINFALIYAETDTFKHDIGVGDEKISCTFTMVFQDTTVNRKQSKAICSRAKKTKTYKDKKIVSPSSKTIYTITMKIRRGSTKGWFKYVFLKLAPTPPKFACVIDVGDNGCSGTLQVMNQNFTLQVNVNTSTLDSCKPKDYGLEVTLHSNSKYCEKYDFFLIVDATVNPNQIIYATAFPKDGTLPCPLIGFDIGCSNRAGTGMNLPDEPCNNIMCFQASSWEECASQCVGVTGTDVNGFKRNYDGWSYQSRAVGAFAGNCCCKNKKLGTFGGNLAGSIFGDAKCVGAGGNSP